MTTLHDNSTIATSWMEHQILGHVKQALRVTLDWEAPVVSMPRKLSSLKFTIKSFQRHLERVMSIEEEGGYMSEVLDVKPNMEERVDALVGDHARFRARMRQLLPELEEISEWDEPQFHEICDDIRALLDEVDRHDELEVSLLMASLLEDEGGEG